MLSEAIKALISNSIEEIKPPILTLLRISSNIIKNPTEVTFKSIRCSSSTFQNKLLPYDGALQCLMEMGFKEDGDRFTFHSDSFKDLKLVHEMLLEAASLKSIQVNPKLLIRNISNVDPLTILSHRKIYQQLQSYMISTRLYEDDELQKKAKSCIPLDKIETKATKIYNSKANKHMGSEISSLEFLKLKHLVAWFKKDFFRWTDKPKCPDCENSEIQPLGRTSPTPNEVYWKASITELYRCTRCSKNLRFPRYNHPEKLLETRTGRCGEWANCFTLICRSAGFESRLVYDWTDHVWTEVYIKSLNRWIHVDSCENVCDKPLLYEKGWKKKLSLIVAVRSCEIIDVTRRYIIDLDGVMSRRSLIFQEDWLKDVLTAFNISVQSQMNQRKKEELIRRQKSEEEELKQHLDREISEDYGGRTSGSLSWRLQRKETDLNSKDQILNEDITPSKDELQKMHFRLEYSSSNDQYYRPVICEEEMCWESLVSRSVGMKRKEELDWKMSYICRKERTKFGLISWRVSLPPGYQVDEVSVKVKSQVFNDGAIKWLLCSDTACSILSPGTYHHFDKKYKTSKIISVNVKLMDDNTDDSLAWQKLQLFRESLDDNHEPSLIIDIKLKDDKDQKSS